MNQTKSTHINQKKTVLTLLYVGLSLLLENIWIYLKMDLQHTPKRRPPNHKMDLQNHVKTNHPKKKLRKILGFTDGIIHLKPIILPR